MKKIKENSKNKCCAAGLLIAGAAIGGTFLYLRHLKKVKEKNEEFENVEEDYYNDSHMAEINLSGINADINSDEKEEIKFLEKASKSQPMSKAAVVHFEEESDADGSTFFDIDLKSGIIKSDLYFDDYWSRELNEKEAKLVSKALGKTKMNQWNTTGGKFDNNIFDGNWSWKCQIEYEDGSVINKEGYNESPKEYYSDIKKIKKLFKKLKKLQA